jgi:hypothetical protein
MIKDYRRAWQMLALNPPESDVFSTAGYKFISFYWTEFNGKNVEIADLFCQKGRFASGFNV